VIPTLRDVLHRELPVTLHLGVDVRQADRSGVILSAPLDSNVNHKGTAFAGSLNAVATLAGWSWCWVLLREERVDAIVVLQDSAIRYQRPVRADFTAHCEPPDAAALGRFLSTLRRRGRARLSLQVVVSDPAGPAASFVGRYVAECSAGAAAAETG